LSSRPKRSGAERSAVAADLSSSTNVCHPERDAKRESKDLLFLASSTDVCNPERSAEGVESKDLLFPSSSINTRHPERVRRGGRVEGPTPRIGLTAYKGAQLQPCHPSPKGKAASAAEGIAALILCATLTACRPHDFPQSPPNYREFAYVTNSESNTVTVLDLVNLRRDREFPVGNDPTGVAISLTRSEVYVVNSGSGTISIIDAQKNAVAATIPVHKKPYFIDVSQDGHRAYVANSGSNNVSVLDLDSRKQIATVGVGEAPGLARISPDNQTLVVTNRLGGSVTVIDGPTLKVRSVFPNCPGATDAVILPDSSKAFIACSAGHQVMAIALVRASSLKGDPNNPPTEAEKSDHLLDFLDVGQSPVSLAMKPDGGEIFVSNFDSNTISEIATGTNEVGGASLIGEHPSRGVVSADNSTLWVSNFSANTIGVYSVDDGQRINAIQVGDGPDALAFSSEGHLLLVANSRSGDVSVIRTTSYSPQGARKIGALFTMLPAAKRPSAIAVKAFMMP
jgi:YVTN family beta-propeller protein